MGVFEKLPYLNYHDINLDWLVRQTKKNASDNTYLMKIFKWFQDHGLVGVVTDITENLDDTVKIEYTETETQTTDDFTVYNKNGVDGLVSGLAGDISGLDGRLDTAEGNITNLQGDVTGLDNRLGTAEGNITSLQGRMGTAEGNITNLQSSKLNASALQTKTVQQSLTVNPGTVYIGDIDITSDPSVLHLIKGFQITGPDACSVAAIFVASNYTITVRVKNNTTGTISCAITVYYC